MKIPNKSILVTAFALLGVTGSQAIPVDLSFSGTVSAATDADFAALLAPGDPVSGVIQFDFDTPFSPVSGGYSVPAGPVSALSLFMYGSGISPDFTYFDFQEGTGPTALVGGFERMLSGVNFSMDIASPLLSDYLALSASDFTITLIGQTDFGNGSWSSGPVADLRLTSASFAPAGQVPDGGGTALLVFSSLGTLWLYRRRTA
jgi:hypothetical protein